jgi:hypothetical protein
MNKIIKLGNEKPVEFDDKDKKEYSLINRLEIEDVPINFFGKPKNIIYNEGYLGYLEKAWKNHYSIVIRPHDIWYMIINELTSAIAKDPKKYSKLFTTIDKKQDIIVLTDNVETIDPSLVINAMNTPLPKGRSF